MTISPNALATFNGSPYDGIAVPIVSAYHLGAAPTIEEMAPKLSELRSNTQKDIWPWVFLNRLIGTKEKQQTGDRADWNGMDLDGKGPQKAFLQLWRLAFQIARQTKSRGVVGDMEAYSDYSLYDISTLAIKTEKKPDEVIRLLESLGSHMADVADEELPGSTIWFLFTAAAEQPGSDSVAPRYHNSTGYILFGMLERIAQRGLRLSIISGGESGLGYCHETLAQLGSDIRSRSERYADLQDRFPMFSLGGTIVLWRDSSAKSDWLTRDKCGLAQAATVEDLEPYLETLFLKYRYVWIYAASGPGGYDPFDAQTKLRFDAVIRKARVAVSETIQLLGQP